MQSVVSSVTMTDENTTFIPGLQLCEAFYHQVVEPIVSRHFGELKFSAALIGSGSEVLGFDTEMSSDHHWGPRVMMFLKPEDVSTYKDSISEKLSRELPRVFRGYPTSFSSPDSENKGVQLLDYSQSGPINHRVEISSIERFVDDYLGFDITTELEACDWLSFPGQKLRTILGGKIFRDDIGLVDTRSRFSYYPEDVWLYLLACAWSRIEQEEHLMGRAGFVGDEVGAGIIAARLVRDMMNLCFLMEKVYAPYPKWFGTAFKGLQCASFLEPLLLKVMSSSSWEERQSHLVPAYEFLAAMHNQLEITEKLPTRARDFHGRPFMVISMGDYSKAICSRIAQLKTASTAIKELAKKPLIGSVEQFSDSTDLLSNSCWRAVIRNFYNVEGSV